MTAEDIRVAIQNRSGVSVSEVDSETLMEAECEYIVAVVPKDFRERIAYFGDMLAQMAMNHKIKDDGLRFALRSIACTFSYLINSTSMRDDQLHSFDKETLKQKLRGWDQAKEEG